MTITIESIGANDVPTVPPIAEAARRLQRRLGGLRLPGNAQASRDQTTILVGAGKRAFLQPSAVVSVRDQPEYG